MGNKYIFNSHIAPITCNARGADGKKVEFTKSFQPERIDGTTGRVVSTGYTALTDAEYDALYKGSRTFKHYLEDLKLLSVRDELPPGAKAPHEALADARREAREARGKVTELTAEVRKLQEAVQAAEDRYGQLASASNGEELIASRDREIEGLKKENEELKAALTKAGARAA